MESQTATRELELGLDTFGDITAAPDGTPPRSDAQTCGTCSSRRS